METMAEDTEVKARTKETTKKTSPWTEVAEVRLCSLVKENWQLLFGEIRGCGVERISVRRRAKWKEIATSVSNEFTAMRTADQCRKKYQNLKSRSISKVSGLRHTPTGGGPAPVLSQAENLIADHLRDHEVVAGIAGGFDSDEPTKASTVVLAAEPGDGARESYLSLQSPEPTESSTVVLVAGDKESCSRCTSGKRKQDIASLTKINLQLDNDRLRAETKKIKLEMEVMHDQRQTLNAVKELAETAKEYFAKKCFTEFCSGEKFIDDIVKSNLHL